MRWINILSFVLVFAGLVSSDKPPAYLLMELANMTLDDYLRTLVRGNDTDEVSAQLWPTETASIPDEVGIGIVAASFGGVGPEVCQPRLSAVELPADDDPSVYKYPMCVAVDRCSGCCGGEMFECAPLATQDREFTVFKNRYDIALGGFVHLGVFKEIVEEHVSCHGRCKVRQEHCNSMHLYDEQNCRCVCTNEHMSALCAANKIWNENRCDCVCLQQLECLEDEFFDDENCRCKLVYASADDSEELANSDVDPCLGLRCRAGFQMTATQEGCRCIMSAHWGIEAASADRGAYEPTKKTTMQPTTIATTPLTTSLPTTRRRRPRPSYPERRRRPR